MQSRESIESDGIKSLHPRCTGKSSGSDRGDLNCLSGGAGYGARAHSTKTRWSCARRMHASTAFLRTPASVQRAKLVGAASYPCALVLVLVPVLRREAGAGAGASALEVLVPVPAPQRDARVRADPRHHALLAQGKTVLEDRPAHLRRSASRHKTKAAAFWLLFKVGLRDELRQLRYLVPYAHVRNKLNCTTHGCREPRVVHFSLVRAARY